MNSDRRVKRRRKKRRGGRSNMPVAAPARVSASPFIRQLALAEDVAKEQPMDPHRLVREVLTAQAQVDGIWTWRHWNGEIFYWDKGRYQVLQEHSLKALVTGALKDHFQRRVDSGADPIAYQVTPARVSGVINALKSVVLVQADSLPLWLDERQGQLPVFAFRNGLLPIDRALDRVMDLEPLDPRWFSRVCFPYAFSAQAPCPRWNLFVAEVLPDPEDQRLLQEIFGYCLVPDTRQHKFFVLEGRGSNGKGVATSVLTELLGEENVSSVQLEEFASSFGLETTIDKLANIVSEINEPGKLPEGIIKQFVSGERMTINRKHLRAVQVLPTARLIISTNELPQFRDQSNGMTRRFVPLRFPVSIPEADQNKALLSELLPELPGIFLWAVEGLRRLRQRGSFELPESSQALLEELRPEVASSQRFLLEQCEEAPSAWVSTEELYEQYRGWCVVNVLRSETKARFCQHIQWVYEGATKQREGAGGRRYGYVGLRKRAVKLYAA